MSMLIKIDLDAREVLKALAQTAYWPAGLDDYELASKDDGRFVFFEGSTDPAVVSEPLAEVSLVVVVE